jgi:hypothetical protein
MAKKEKNIIEQKWLTIKSKSKTDNYDIKELDHLTCELIAHLSLLTVNGVKEIDGVSIDTYKDRVWWVVEKIGLLPEYRDEDEKEILEMVKDDWEKVEEDFDYEIDDSKFYR